MRFYFLLAFFAGCIHFSGYGQATWYVKSDATGANNGTSWANAFTQLQAALNAAQPGDQVWVSRGTYYPTQAADGVSADVRHRAFVLPDGVQVYGGFAGNESSGFDLAQRDFLAHTTILSGDLDQNDVVSNGVTTTPFGNNAYHVVIGANITDAVLNGITITGGLADGGGVIAVNGQSLLDYNAGGLALMHCVIILQHVVIDGNHGGDGAGIFTVGDDITLRNGYIINNTSSGLGGGIVNYGGNINFLVENTIIENNSALDGGGLYIAGKIDLLNVIVRNNSAETGGGGLVTGGAICTITNSLIVDNTATGSGYGGAGWGGILGSIIYFTNVTITHNRAPAAPAGGILGGTSSDFVYLRNSIVRDNEAVGNGFDANVLRLIAGNSIITNAFIDDAGVFHDGYVTSDVFRNAAAGDYTLAINSEAINAGDNAWYAAGATPDLSGITTDLGGAGRIVAGTVDLGAYECPISPDADGILYVNGGASPTVQTGASWGSPLKELADALSYTRQVLNQSPGLVKQVWVASGTYRPMYTFANVDNFGLPTTDRDKTFLLPTGVQVYGGFTGTPGTEGDFADRDWELFLTILDGDVDQDTENDENAYHVVLAAHADSNTVLDGFYIRNGNADATPNVPTDRVVLGATNIFRTNGGGLYVLSSVGLGVPRFQNLRIMNNSARTGGGCFKNGAAVFSGVVFENNQSYDLGGGLYSFLGPALVDNCQFLNNQSVNAGGGWYNFFGDPVIAATSFTGNQAINGGGLYVAGGAAQIDSVLFSGNTAVPTTANSEDGFGGGLYNNGQNITLINSRFLQNHARRGGGIYNRNAGPLWRNLLLVGNTAGWSGAAMENDQGSPTMVNGRLSGNQSLLGAGMHTTNGNPVLIHTTFTNNGSLDGPAVYNTGGTVTLKNSVVRGNLSAIQDGAPLNGTFSYSHTLVQDTWYGANNGISQPVALNDADLFIDPRPTAEIPTIAGDYRPATNSWLIDKGDAGIFDPAHTPDISAINTDLAGILRISGTAPDLGSYESNQTLPVSLLYFHAEKSNGRVRLTWATAMEQHNDRFEIEHSSDGQQYTLLHTEKAAGNSATPQHYEAYHYHPAPGVNYYRLKQFDADGRIHVLGVRTVDMLEGMALPVRLYPNPAPGFFRIALPALSGKLHLQVINGAGAVVHREVLQLAGASTNITVRPRQKLPAGRYNVQLSSDKLNTTIAVFIE